MQTCSGRKQSNHRNQKVSYDCTGVLLPDIGRNEYEDLKRWSLPACARRSWMQLKMGIPRSYLAVAEASIMKSKELCEVQKKKYAQMQDTFSDKIIPLPLI